VVDVEYEKNNFPFLIQTVCSFLLVCILTAMLAGCAGMQESAKPVTVPEIRPGFLLGYLPQNALPNSQALLPPPPAMGSTASTLDKEISRKSAALRGTPRWRLAVSDADLQFPHAASTFSCALDAPVTQEHTPHLYQLLRRMLTDAGLSTYAAKIHYKRPRPFLVNKEPICTPNEKAALAKDGSYPSGHTAIGWAWALTLTEVAPEHTDALLARGLAFGRSRIVCNVHWYSDVLQGRVMGAAIVARLNAEPAFRKDVEAARKELTAERTQHLKPARDCAVEAAALKQHIPVP